MVKIISPSIRLCEYDRAVVEDALRKVEWAGRTCYKSESKFDRESRVRFTDNLIRRGHLSVLEHVNLTVKIVCDRGVSHELVRHRLGSYSQESTRYCTYHDGLVVIKPCFFRDVPTGSFNGVVELSTKYEDIYDRSIPLDLMYWADAMFYADAMYSQLLALGRKPQESRAVLPNSLKTEVVVTYNLRQWRHFLETRALGRYGRPHPQMVEVATMILQEFKNLVPVVFDDLVGNDG